MAIWWMTEAVPLAATALLPIVWFPMLDIEGISETAASFAHPLIFLFLGGFLLAKAMSVWSLDRRLALFVLRRAGANPRALIGALMIVTAFLSMWVSNTATAMVMLPIAISIAKGFPEQNDKSSNPIATAMLLGIAYAATIGGMGTIIGTPPNALFAAFMSDTYGIEISFFRWMLVGLPLVVIILPIAWLVLTRVAFKVPSAGALTTPDAIHKKLVDLGPVTVAERLLIFILLGVATAWVSRPLIIESFPGLHLSDAGIAMTGALLTFLIPVNLKEHRFLLSWEAAAKIRWDVLILFGGGLALAGAASSTGLAAWLGSLLTGFTSLPHFILLLLIGLLIVFVGELASNTAMAAVFLPISGAIALSLGAPPIFLTLPVALFATLGFMLPVATPPNAIIFGSGKIQSSDMLRAGFILDVVGILIVAVLVLVIGDVVFLAN